LCETALLVGNVGLSASSVAGAEQVLQQAVGYVKDRKQFGVSVGSFQAVKHPLANLFAEIESARSAYHYAAWAVSAHSPDVLPAVAVARLCATAAYRQATLTSVQAHGGIGFTWEYDLHLYLKRAKHNEYFLGIPGDYEEIVAREALGI
jgi:alkylation response protein AidB-like acyl-CoA dehydrogenase